VELFGIIFAIPAVFIAAAIYAGLIPFVFRYRLVTRKRCGFRLRYFYPVHLVLFSLTVPALANLLIIKKSGTILGTWFTVALLCSVLALAVVLTQYGVAEALYGVDGDGGPYGQAPTIPMPAWW
jgi:hypothetical protein